MRIDDKLKAELRGELRADRYDMTPEGVYFPRNGINVNGQYFGRLNGGEWSHEGDNLVVDEGLQHILAVVFGATSKAAGFYLTLFMGSTAPTNLWKASNFASAANENTSQSEGYDSNTRPVWTPGAVTGTSIDNLAAPAELTFATASSVEITGAAMLTSSQRGGTSGVLVSASAFAVPRIFQDGDEYELGYRINATV